MKNTKDINSGNLGGITTYQAGVVQASVNRMLQKHCDDILGHYGITKNQWLIIGTVSDAGSKGARISEIAVLLGTTLSYLTNTINLLETKNMLTRVSDTKDNRSKYVSVNKKFAPKVAKIEQTLRYGLRESVYSHIGQEDLKIYIKVMYQLQNIDKDL